jgi:NADP-dependent 3-hydroxy acid dehydrogenase YdfG
MNRIILAFAPENTVLAETLDHSLSRIGIPFEYASQHSPAEIAAAGEPVLWMITDNFLKNRQKMEGLLSVMQGMAADNRLTAVVADGIDPAGNAVPTSIDRMAGMLHYMNHWQNAWLALSEQHQHAQGAEKEALLAELDAVRKIANEIGEVINLLREQGFANWQQLAHNDYALFFQKFGLQDWHGQYKKFVAQQTEASQQEAPHLPEMPVSGGLLTPEPAPQPEAIRFVETSSEPPEPLPLEPEPDFVAEEMTADHSEPIEQSARDAWFWLERGHIERGFDLFQSALEQYPQSEWLQAEYARASAQFERKIETQPLAEPGPEPTPNTRQEANSYELMGDMAAERGDYLFAKYCWDRVLELDPAYPGIYRKLGLMTAEHLHDYRETAATYLQKALEIEPDDPELMTALRQELPDSTPKIPAPVVAPEPDQTKSTQHTTLVLITGATSGIGRATAEIFAKNGYRLILTGRRVERLVALKNRFEAAYGSDVLLLPFDVRDAGAVEAALDNLPEQFREIDILINNAGLAKGLAPIHEGQLEHWETMIDTNVKGLLYVTRIVSQGMVQRRRGHIINIGSSAGKEAYPNGNVYCATKFAVDALTKSMRFDLHAYNIRVSQVSPGHVEETEFALNRFDGDAERARIYNDFQPLKSSDVAEAIYFMATRPPHVNIQDLQLFATQQASSMVINRSGR